MKKLLTIILAATLLLSCVGLCSCTQTTDSNVTAVSKFKGNTDITIYSDSALIQKHSGKCEVGKTYYVLIKTEVTQSAGVLVSEVGSTTLSIEFPSSDAIVVSQVRGDTMTSSPNGDSLVYTCKAYKDNTYSAVFKFVSTESEAFDIKVAVDQNISETKVIDFE